MAGRFRPAGAATGISECLSLLGHARPMPMKPPIAIVLVALLACAAAAPAPAAEPGAGPSPAEAGAQDKPLDDNSVTLPTLIAPLVEGRRLTGYLYLSLRLSMASNGDANRLRDVLPLVQDKLLRALHDAPVPAAEASRPETREALTKTVMGALAQLSEIHGIKDVAFADYQAVPF
jgi:flagellar basal body-associated protein FliL